MLNHPTGAAQQIRGADSLDHASTLQLLEARQVTDLFKAEVREERFRCPISDRTTRRLTAAARPDPAGFEQDVERAGRRHNSTNFFDFCTGDGLMVCDDRKCLGCGTRKLACFDDLLGQQPRQIGRRPECPLFADLDRLTPRVAYSSRSCASAVFTLTSLGSLRANIASSSGSPAANRSASSSRNSPASCRRHRRLRLRLIVLHHHELFGRARHGNFPLMSFLVRHTLLHFHSRRRACAYRSARMIPSGGFPHAPHAPFRARTQTKKQTLLRQERVQPHS